jgi:hypothetical protein
MRLRRKRPSRLGRSLAKQARESSRELTHPHQKRGLVRSPTSPVLEPTQALGELLKNPLKLEPGRLAIERPPLLLRPPPKALREEELL